MVEAPRLIPGCNFLSELSAAKTSPVGVSRKVLALAPGRSNMPAALTWASNCWACTMTRQDITIKTTASNNPILGFIVISSLRFLKRLVEVSNYGIQLGPLHVISRTWVETRVGADSKLGLPLSLHTAETTCGPTE